MTIKETIKRILREQTDDFNSAINKLDKNVKNSILRRLELSTMADALKKNSLRMFKKGGSIDSGVVNGAYFTAKNQIPFHDDEGRDFDDDVYDYLIETFKNYLLNNYGEQGKEYLEKVLSDNIFVNDGNRYVFIKHSELGGGNGFSEGFDSWGDLVLRFGWLFPLDWWKIKAELDKKEKADILILRPGEKHNNYQYYFSIKKIPEKN